MRSFSVCVFCGSRQGADPAYEIAAQGLGAALAGAGMRLVYGAGDVGLMGAVAQAAMAAGGEALGVIPTHLVHAEIAKSDLTVLIETETMHERKKVMFRNSDAVVLLPGGAGSLDEFFEGLTWVQLGLQAQPIFILNTNGYWDPLIALVTHVVDQGFANRSLLEHFEVFSETGPLMARLEAHRRA